jgi:hypothetical protein
MAVLGTLSSHPAVNSLTMRVLGTVLLPVQILLSLGRLLQIQGTSS